MADHKPCVKCLTRDPYPPYHYFTVGPNNETLSGGVFAEVMRIFTEKYHICHDIIDDLNSPWGGYIKENDTFTGSLQKLQTNKLDLMIVPSFLDSNRIRLLGYSFQIGILPMTAVFSAPKVEPNMLGFVQTFRPEAWSVIGAMLFLAIVVSFLQNVFVHFLLTTPKGQKRTNSQKWKTWWKNAVMWIWRPFVAQGIPDLEKMKWIKKLFLGSWILMTLFLNMIYKCNLKAALILPVVKLPFQNFEEMGRQNEIGITHFRHTLFHSALQNAPSDSTLGRLYSLTKFTITSYSQLDLYSGEYVYISNWLGMYIYMKQSVQEFPNTACKLILLKEGYWARPQVLLYRKNFEHQTIFNDLLMRLSEGGILDHLLDDEMSVGLRCMKSTVDKDISLRPLALTDVMGIFGVLLGGLVLASIVFFVEILCAKRNRLE